jgi:hypothetical protein
LSGWRQLFGEGIEAARSFSLVCAAGAAVMLAGMVRGAGGGEAAALLAALFFLLSPTGIYAATTARPYALALLLIVGAAWTACLSGTFRRPPGAAVRPHPFLLSGCGALAALAVLANYLAAIPSALLGLWIMVRGLARRDWRMMSYFVLGAAVPLLASLWMLSGQLGSRPGAWAGFAGLPLLGETSLLTLKQLAPYDFFSPLLNTYGGPVSLGMVSLAVALGTVFVPPVAGSDRKAFRLLLVLLAFGNITGLVLAGALTDKSLTYNRFTYAAIPFLACLAAFGCGRRFRQWRVGLLLALPILLLQIFWIYEVQVQLKSAQEWRTLADFAAGRLPGDDTLLLIDAGHGRGVPGAMIYELAAGAKVRLVTGRTDPEQLYREIRPYRYLFMIMSWQREGNRRLAGIEQALLRLGTHRPYLRVLDRHPVLRKSAANSPRRPATGRG